MSEEEQKAVEQQVKAEELISQNKANDSLPLYDEAARLYEAASRRYSDLGNQKDSLRCLGLSGLSQSQRMVAQAIAIEDEKRYEESANLFQEAGEELRNAARQFAGAGFPLEEKYALAYLGFCKGKFYESQSLRHLAAYDLGKALKYSENAASAYSDAFQTFDAVSLQSLFAGRVGDAEVSTLKIQLEESKRHVERLQEELSRAASEAERAKKEAEQLKVAQTKMQQTAREEVRLAKADSVKIQTGKKYVAGMVGVTSAYALANLLLRDLLEGWLDSRLSIAFLAIAVIVLYIGYEESK